MKMLLTLACGLTLRGATGAQAATATVTVNKIDENGVGTAIGMLKFEDTSAGLKITADLLRLPAGNHGFHVHANGNCGPGEENGNKAAGLAAGGHFDPIKTGKRMGPESNEGHKATCPFSSSIAAA
jgi:Cu-Zn family superoxide dismutase